jgi:hypothetical protein
MEKEVLLGNNQVIRLSTSQDRRIIIHGGLLNGEMLENDYVLFMSSEFRFCGYTKDHDQRKISFDFDDSNPLYVPLLDLLGDEKELIIDDDNTYYENVKYMRIYQENKIVHIEFVNKVFHDYNKFDFDNFSIFVNGITPNDRSKLDCKDKKLKYRLQRFFMESITEIKTFEKGAEK